MGTFACCIGNFKIVRLLIHYGADVNIFDNGRHNGTPLHYLITGKDVNKPCMEFNCPSKKICVDWNKLSKIADLLIQNGADINSTDSASGETPLHVACHEQTELGNKFAEYLIRKGAKGNAVTDKSRIPKEYTRKKYSTSTLEGVGEETFIENDRGQLAWSYLEQTP